MWEKQPLTSLASVWSGMAALRCDDTGVTHSLTLFSLFVELNRDPRLAAGLHIRYANLNFNGGHNKDKL
jgi:hypothetical protein